MKEGDSPQEDRFRSLSPVEFESLCYDLLVEEGFENLNWRKGTPRKASPADQGRDIECSRRHRLPGGRVIAEQWFVECKHYDRGVGPEALQGAISWAQAKQPDRLLFILSGFLSNPAKEYLEQFEANNSPAFTIEVWERPDLRRLVSGRDRLLAEYDLQEGAKLRYIHPLHVRFIREHPVNTLDYFLDVLDQLPESRREEYCGYWNESIIQPRYRKPQSGNERMIDLRIDPVDYDILKEKCRVAARRVGDVLLVHGMVSFGLGMMRRAADPAGVARVRNHYERFIVFLEQRIEQEDERAEDLRKLIRKTEGDIKGLPGRIERNRRQYENFCHDVVAPLLEEEIDVPASVDDLPFVEPREDQPS